MKIIIIILIAAILLRFYYFNKAMPDYSKNDSYAFTTVLHESPVLSNRGQTMQVKDRYHQTIFVTTSTFPKYQMGQRIYLEGKVVVKEVDNKRLIYTSKYPTITVITDIGSQITSYANILRERSHHLYESYLPPILSSLLMGIVFGSKEQFPEDFITALQSTGVLHIVAASGMNVAFVGSAILIAANAFIRRQYAILTALAGIYFYVLMVGMQPSIVRAAIMATFGMCAALIGRQHFAFLAVIISGYLMLFIQPGYLFDLGFQLSFLATIGIICLKPIFPIKAGMFGDVIATTIATQIATLPVLLMAIGKVGIFSILVNLLVLWTIPFIMFLGSIAAIVNLFFSVGASIFIIIAIPLLVYMSIIISTFGSWGGVISFDSMPWYFSAAYYAFLTALILKKRTYLLTTTLSQSFASERHG